MKKARLTSSCSMSIAIVLLAAWLAFAAFHNLDKIDAAPDTTIRNATVFQNSKAIGNIPEPPPFSSLEVQVERSDARIELVVQIRPVTNQRLLVVSELNELIITTLAAEGVVGHPVEGGYEIDVSREDSMLRINGVLPQGSKQAAVAYILTQNPSSTAMLLEVKASVKRNQIIPPTLKRIWPWIVVAVLLIAFATYFVQSRRQPTPWGE